MASKTSVFFLVLCGIFLVIFLAFLVFLLYFFLRRACIVKAIEISHAEAKRQRQQFNNGDRFQGFMEPDLTSISTPVAQNEHSAIAGPMATAPEKPAVEKEDIQLTIL